MLDIINTFVNDIITKYITYLLNTYIMLDTGSVRSSLCIPCCLREVVV